MSISIISRLIGAAPRAAYGDGAPSGNPADDRYYNISAVPSRAGVFVSPDVAMKASAVYRCVSILANVLAMFPKGMFERLDRGRRPAPEHPLDPIIGFKPNQRQSDFEFWRQVCFHLVLRQNAYVQIVKGTMGRGWVGQLIPLQPDRIKGPEELPDGRLRYVYTGSDNRPTPLIGGVDVWHLQGLSTDGLKGMSMVDVANDSFGVSLAAERHAARFFERGVKPTGILEHPRTLKQGTADEMSSSFTRRYGGEHGTGTIPVLWEGMQFKPISMTLKDAEFLDSRKFSVAEIARWFGVPPHMVGDVERSTCLPADAQVFTERGPRPIKDVQVGDRVWSLDEAGKGFRLARVWRSERTGNDPILRISTRGRTVRANARHRFLVRRRFVNKQPGRRNVVRWENLWVPAADLVVGDYLVALKALPAAASTTAPNGRLLTEGFMALAGMLIGDGTVLKGAVSIARHQEAPYMEAYRGFASAEMVSTRRGGRGNAQARQTRPILVREYERHTAFSSVLAADELRELGLSGVAHTKRVPEWVFGLAPELVLAFLRGYLDADGAVNSRGWITYSSCNTLLLEDVRHLCMAVGVPVGTVRRYAMRGQVVVGGRTVDRGDMYQLFAFNIEENRRIGSHHPVKSRRLAEAPLSKKRGRWSDDYTGRGPSDACRPGTKFDVAGGALAAITAIDHEGAEAVYDLGVEGTHSFIADGIVVHNSWGTGIESQGLHFLIYSLLPWITLIERSIQFTFVVQPERFYPKMNVNALLRMDAKAQADVFGILIDKGVLNPNECRELLERNPRPGGDEYVQLNTSPPAAVMPEPASPTPEEPEEQEDEPQDDGPQGRALLLARALARNRAAELLQEERNTLAKIGRVHSTSARSWRSSVATFYGEFAARVASTMLCSRQIAKGWCEARRKHVLTQGLAGLESLDGAGPLAELALTEALNA